MINKEIQKSESQKENLIRYLKDKIDDEDWHGVADAAMDLRDIENYIKGLKFFND